jgi:hypothetical protein
MMLGMSLATFTLFHVILSLVGIAAGLVVLHGMLAGKRLENWTIVFLATTVATSVTGFMFPFHQLLASHKVGILSLIVLAIAIPARYTFHLAGRWRTTYVVTAMIALYFNVFVLIAQAFQKVPPLKALAPTGSEPPFLITELVVMVLFIYLGFKAVKNFRIETAAVAAA